MHPLLESSSMLLEISRRRISLRNEVINWNYAGNRDSNVHYLRRLCTLSCPTTCLHLIISLGEQLS
jgi:hypothetical protein